MTDYDLGKAHGRIEIEADIDSDRAAKGLDDVGRSANKAGRSLSSVERDLSKLEAMLIRTQHRLNEVADSIGRTTRKLTEMSAAAVMASASMAGLGDNASDIGRNLLRLGMKAKGLIDTFKELTSFTGLATAGLSRFTDVGRRMEKLPQWAKHIRSVSAKMSAAAAVMALVTAKSAGARAAMSGFASTIMGKLAPAISYGSSHSAKFRAAIEGISEASRRGRGALNLLGATAKGTERTFRNLRQGIFGFVMLKSGFGDLAKITNGVKALVKSIPPLQAALAAVGFASLKYLPALASGFLNVASATKALLGVVMMVPGSIITIGVIGATAALGISALSKAFSAGMGDAKNFDKAVEDLSPKMAEFARSIQGVKDEYEGLSSEVAEEAFSSLMNSFSTIATEYLPLLKNGFSAVAKGLNESSRSLTKFAQNDDTIRDLGVLFSASASVARNFGVSLGPLMDGLRNIGTIGAVVFAKLTGGMLGASLVFRRWTSDLRNDGSMKAWMEKGIQGLRDLRSSIKDFASGVGDLFRTLGGSASANPLGRMANAAAKFRETMEAAANGRASEVFSAIASTASRVHDSLVRVGKAAYKVAEALAPIASSFGEAFSSRAIAAIETAASVIASFLRILGSFDGVLGTVLGTLLGASVAMKILGTVVKPLIGLFKALVGALILGKTVGGFSNALLGMAVAMDKAKTKTAQMSGVAGKLSGPLGKASNGLLAMAAAGPALAIGIGVAIAAIGGIWHSYSKGRDAQKKIQQDYKDSAAAAKEFGKEVMAANGAISEAAKAKSIEASKSRKEAWEGEAKSQTLGERAWGAVKAMRGPGAGDEAEERDREVAAAQGRNRAMFKVVGDTDEEIATAATSASSTFDGYIERLHKLGDDGVNAAAKLKELRTELMGQKEAADRVGESNLKISNGLAKLADESSSALDKLNALKQVLQGLGLLATDAEDAMATYTLKIREMKKSADELTNSTGIMGKALIANGRLNLFSGDENTTIAASELLNYIKEYTDTFLEASIATGDAKARFKEMAPIIDALGRKFGMNSETIRNLVAQYGLVPEAVQTAISVIGADKSQEELAAIILQMNNLPEGKEVSVVLRDKGARDQLGELDKYVKGWNPETGELKLNIPPGLKPELQAKIAETLGEQGISISAHVEPAAPGAPATPPKVSYTKPQGNQPGAKTPVPGQPAAATPPPPTQTKTEPPKETKTTVKVEGWESSEGTLKRIKSLAESLRSVQASITVKVLGWDSTEGTLNRIKGLAASLKSVSGNITVRVVGWQSTEETLNRLKGVAESFRAVNAEIHVKVRDEASSVLDAIKAKVEELAGAVESMRDRFVSAMNQCVEAANRLRVAVEDVRNTMDTVAASASARGASLGEGFAKGIESKVGRVQAAAMALAEAARRPLPSSPAKIGPFSGRGWTPFRGKALAEGFAQGIHSGSDSAQQASLDMVAKIVQAMDMVRVAFGVTPTFFNENRAVGKGGKKYYRDPNVTDEDLRKAREEQKKQDEKQARLDAEKAAEDIPKAKEKIAKAEERVQKAEERLEKAKGSDGKKRDESIKSAEESLQKAKDALGKDQARLKELEATASNPSYGGATSEGSKKVDDFVRSMDDAQYGMGAFNSAMVDCSAFVSSVANVATGRDPFSERANTTNLRPFLLARGFKEGRGGEGDLSVAWWDRGGGANGHAALTTGSGLNAESTTGGVRFGEGSAGARSNNGQFTDFMYLPMGGKDSRNLERVAGSTGATAEATEKTVPLIKNADGTYSSSNAEWNRLIQRESGGRADVIQGIQDANSGGNEASGLFQIAKGTWAANGGKEFAETAGQATAEQQAKIATRIFEKSGAQPWGNRENEEALRAGLTTPSGDTSGVSSAVAEGSTDTVEELRKSNKKLDESIRIAKDPRSSEGQVIRALQDIDDQMVGMSETERDALDGVRAEIMSERGIKEYDPYENAPKTPKEWFDTVFGGIMQNLLGLYNTIEQGVQATVDAIHLIARGVSSTDDVNTLVDGFQGLANTVMTVVSTVGTMIEMAGNIAAAVGSAIPGIGQIGGVIGGITGVVGDVNSVIDFVQEVASIGGRWIGKGISNLMGFLGGTGELQGQIRTLMDMNDNTIKTWSDRNTADKAVIGGAGRPGGGRGNDPNQTGAFRDLNIYQGPGSDPAEMMNNAMFAVAAHSQGVYGA